MKFGYEYLEVWNWSVDFETFEKLVRFPGTSMA